MSLEGFLKSSNELSSQPSKSSQSSSIEFCLLYKSIMSRFFSTSTLFKSLKYEPRTYDLKKNIGFIIIFDPNSLLPISGFVLDEKFQWNASKFAVFYMYEKWKAKVVFSIFHFGQLFYVFPNECPGLCRHRPGHSLGKT